jgi:hypothetical protein
MREGLVALWSGEENANDIVGANNGEAQNIAYTNGKVGHAFVFNTTNAAVKVAASPSLNVGAGGGFTVECWINPPDLQVHPIVEWNNGTGSYGVHFYIDVSAVGNLYANIVDSGGSYHIIQTGSGVVMSNVFQHVALTYDQASGVATMYCNGAVVLQQRVGSFTFRHALDFHRLAAGVVNFNHRAVQLHVVARHFKPLRHGGAETLSTGWISRPKTLSCGPVKPASVRYAVPPGKICSSAVCTCVCVPTTALTWPSSIRANAIFSEVASA